MNIHSPYFDLLESPVTEMFAETTLTESLAPFCSSWMIQMHSVDLVTLTGLVIVEFVLVTTPPQAVKT